VSFRGPRRIGSRGLRRPQPVSTWPATEGATSRSASEFTVAWGRTSRSSRSGVSLESGAPHPGVHAGVRRGRVDSGKYARPESLPLRIAPAAG